MLKRWRYQLALLIMLSCSILVLLSPPFDPQAPSVITILPPMLALTLAFLLRQVILALAAGLWFGAWIVRSANWEAIAIGFIDLPAKYLVLALSQTDHILLVLVTVFIGGMMSVIYRNGGMSGLVNIIASWANTQKRAQLSTAAMGLVIFFDDYSNTLLTGNTMCPLMDKLKVSREKLAYIVDSTAAPIASLAVISLWVGFQVGLIDSATSSIEGLPSAFVLFLYSLGYSFYPILAVFFVFMIGATGRDFGPMLTAERRAKQARGPSSIRPDEHNTTPRHSSADNALIPIAGMVLTMIAGLYITGEGSSLLDILGSADPFRALLVAAFLGSVVAIILSVFRRLMSLNDAIDSWITGASSIAGALIILILSWALAALIKEMNTVDYIIPLIGDAIPTPILPAVVFILAAIIALGTGSSWGTMAILMPIVIPLSWTMITRLPDIPVAENMHLFYSSISAVLAGSVWGDHCSPISDTTVLSSMASQCDHLAHVRTQLPYALLVAAVAILFGILPVGFGLPWWLGLVACFASLAVVFRLLARPH